MPSDEIEGLSGELIDLLIEVLNNDAHGVRTVSQVVGWAHGLVDVFGHAGSDHLSRDERVELLQQRLCDLVTAGMFEPFLVRSIRDEIRRMLAHGANNIGGFDRKRAELREQIESGTPWRYLGRLGAMLAVNRYFATSHRSEAAE
jgi:hypothetical protein